MLMLLKALYAICMTTITIMIWIWSNEIYNVKINKMCYGELLIANEILD